MKRIILRGHHLLCSRLFQGNGYNEEFVQRMGEITARLGLHGYNNPKTISMAEKIFIVRENDYVCEKCPNAAEVNGKKGCILGTEDVLKKDSLTIKYLGIEQNREYTLQEIERSIEAITQEQFNEICGTCRWYREGYCRFEDICS